MVLKQSCTYLYDVRVYCTDYLVRLYFLSMQEPEGAYSELNPSTERYAELGSLEEKNLLEFARQIAAGMVTSPSIIIIIVAGIPYDSTSLVLNLYHCHAFQHCTVFFLLYRNFCQDWV